MRASSERAADAGGGGSPDVLARDATLADGLVSQTLGCRGRSLDEGEAIVLEFGSEEQQLIDMVGVPVPLDVVWLVDREVQRVETLRPWFGVARARANTVVELPAGAGGNIAAGDELLIDRAAGEADG